MVGSFWFCSARHGGPSAAQLDQGRSVCMISLAEWTKTSVPLRDIRCVPQRLICQKTQVFMGLSPTRTTKQITFTGFSGECSCCSVSQGIVLSSSALEIVLHSKSWLQNNECRVWRFRSVCLLLGVVCLRVCERVQVCLCVCVSIYVCEWVQVCVSAMCLHVCVCEWVQVCLCLRVIFM